MIELLVVIAIISLLVSILLPSLQAAKKLAQQTVCMSNLHGIGLAIVTYQNEFKYVPHVLKWAEDFIDNKDILVCPADPYEGMRVVSPSDSRMWYPYSEDWGDHSVRNSYWSLVTACAVWGVNGNPPSSDLAQAHAEEMTGEAGYIPALDRDWEGGQEFCYLRCMEGHADDGVYPTLTPSGRVVLYEPPLPSIWDCWPDWYRMEGY